LRRGHKKDIFTTYLIFDFWVEKILANALSTYGGVVKIYYLFYLQ